MKKIMFNDHYGLTEAVLSGRKTQTRRIIKLNDVEDYTADIAYAGKTWEVIEKSIIARHAKYKVGEVVAVAQSYKDADIADCPSPIENIYYEARYLPGWTNKMFVRADLMPHRIRITNVRVERLNEISDADCIAEGVNEVCFSNNWGNSASHWEYNVPYEDDLGRAKLLRGLTPQEAYAALIDRISGNGTFQRNPWVFVYDFELVK